MLFNTIEFAIFAIVVFYAYWALRHRLRWQNAFVVAASYFFYAYWDWRFLSLLLVTTGATYASGLLIERAASKRRAKAVMWACVALNIGMLAFFKYFHFFAAGAQTIAAGFGYRLDWVTTEILLPIGISFYTFQAVGYTVDVYKGRTEASHDPLAFMAFIAFFPQLIAGPIERASDLLPQFRRERTFRYDEAVLGMRQILWGLAKKVLVADGCAFYAGAIYDNPDFYSGSSVVLALFLFIFQLYGDYSGYSDIAVGLGRLLGIRLTQNFRYPLFARSIPEFWQRWNITLMRWLRDYVYIPLGGNRKGRLRKWLNILAVFIVSAVWHSAAWGFIVWGVLNALAFIPSVVTGRKVPREEASLRNLPRICLVYVLMSLICITYQFPDIGDCLHFFSCMGLSGGQWVLPTGKTPLLFIIPMLIVEWLARRNSFALERMPMARGWRWLCYWVILLLIIYGASYPSQPYVYFQF